MHLKLKLQRRRFVHSMDLISTCIIAALVQTQTKSFTGWDDNILRSVQRIRHSIWMLKLLNMTKFGDAETKGEKCHHFTQTPCAAQRHLWPWASPRPDGQDVCDPLPGLVCRTSWQAAQTRYLVIISSKIGAVWAQTNPAPIQAAFWKHSSNWLMIIHSWLDSILLFMCSSTNLKFRSLCIASLTSSKLTPGEIRRGGKSKYIDWCWCQMLVLHPVRRGGILTLYEQFCVAWILGKGGGV